MMDKLNYVLDNLEIKYPNFYEKHSRGEFEEFKYRLLAKVDMKNEDDLIYVVNMLTKYAFDNNGLNICYKTVDGNIVFDCPFYSILDDSLAWHVILKLHSDLKDEDIKKIIVDLRNINNQDKMIDLRFLLEYLKNSNLDIITLIDKSTVINNRRNIDALRYYGSMIMSEESDHLILDNEYIIVDKYVVNIDENIDNCMEEAIKFDINDKMSKK